MAKEQISDGETKSDGPYLAFAVICERVLREIDGVLSLIRIFDTLTINGSGQRLSPTNLPLSLAVSFRKGGKEGKATVLIRPRSPSGGDLPGIEQPILFQGGQSVPQTWSDSLTLCSRKREFIGLKYFLMESKSRGCPYELHTSRSRLRKVPPEVR